MTFAPGKSCFETKDVGDLRSAPRIDRLVVVADAAEIAARLGEQLQPVILDCVGVLIFVDQDVSKSISVGFEHVGVRAEDGQHVQQQVAEVAGVQGAQSVLVGGVKLPAATVGEGLAFSGVDVCRGPAAVLPAVDDARQLPRRPALLVEVRGDDQLLQQPQLVVGVEDGEVRLQARPARHGCAASARRPNGRCRARACPRPRRR